MTVDVLYFGVLKDLRGCDRERCELGENALLGDLLDLLERREALNSPIWRSMACAVNREYALPGSRLHEGDEVALLPPVSGGSDAR